MFGIHGRTSAVANSRRSTRQALRRSALVTALVTAGVLAFAANAFATTGTPINIGTPYDIGALQDAVDSSGTAFIAWSNTKELPPATTDIVQYCVLPVAATTCSHSGSLVPADGASAIDNVQVLVDQSTTPETIVILADVYGATGAKAGDYEPEQEWQSTDGGNTWLVVDSGLSVADGILSADTAPVSAVQVPGTNVLGYGWETVGSLVSGIGDSPTFDEFPLTAPPECSTVKCPADELYSVLEPDTNPDQIGNPSGSEYASQLGASPGVLGVFSTDFSNGPLACSPGDGFAYAYGSGLQGAGNSYDSATAAGAGSAWKVLTAEGDCNVENFAVGGGPSGFGVLEEDTADNDIVYHQFNQGAMSFAGTPLVTIAANQSESDPAVSQDGEGGIYATFLDGGGGEPIALAYSYNGGATWVGPAAINPDTDGGASDVTSAVGTSGQGWATWTDNGSVYAQQFNATDAISTPAPTAVATGQTSGTTTGIDITVPAGTVGETDRATITGTNAATATGTVSYGLFSKSDCAASSLVFNGGTQPVSGGAGGASSPVTSALSPGTYYWQASYSGNAGSILGAGNAPSVSGCGSEKLTMSPATTLGGGGSSSGGSVTITVSCAVTPCTVTVTITIDPPSHTTRAVAAKKKGKKKPKIVTIAKGTVKIRKHGKRQISIKLTKAGKKLLKKDHGHLKAKLLVSTKVDGHRENVNRTIHITTPKKHHKH